MQATNTANGPDSSNNGKRKRGRPKGSVDKMPRKPPSAKKKKAPSTAPAAAPPPSRADLAVERALQRRQQAAANIEKAKAALAAAEKEAKAIDATYVRCIEKQADSKLMDASASLIIREHC